ncbi:glycosyltransferase [Chryseobacterium flavum]|uniref:glycosyltransferase n=1 Tax=Chryseobacterium flavum TaxID=415851 RepID=UPI0028AA2EC0|nr:glycosyltransferase [Chryseobacterium flavum]
MILLDSLYINNSGGKILLDYLVKTLEENNILTYYLFDDRCKNDYHYIPQERKVFIKASLLNRYRFYKKNRDRFVKVLCFGNLGPSIPLKVPAYTYFHQSMYLNIPKELGGLPRVIFKIKKKVFQYLLKNTDFLLVQSSLMKEQVEQKLKLSKEKILIIPFYPEQESVADISRMINSFIYVSGGHPHKNHIRLMDAFCSFFDKTKKGTLTVTIGEDHVQLLNTIKERQKRGYPIENIGFISRGDLSRCYKSNEYLVFPSLEESFGLGIVEAIDGGCKVIGSDLPYMYEVCDPSIVFNPVDTEDIERAFEDAIVKNEKKTRKKIYNQVDELINILKK